MSDMKALVAQLDKIAAEQNSLVGEIREARKPVYGAARRTVHRMAKAHKPTGQNPFRSSGELLRFARDITLNAAGSAERAEQYHRYLDECGVFRAAPSGMNTVVGADGGVLVSPEFVNTLLMKVYDENDLLARTTMLPIGSGFVEIPAIDETSRADGSRFGGVQAYWRSEGASVSASKGKAKKIRLTPEGLDLNIRVTDELLADGNSAALDVFVNEVAEQEIKFKVGDAIINGDGVGKPLGLLNSSSVVSVAKETGQGAATLQSKNIVKMYSRLHAGCRPGAVWLYDQSIEPELMTMTIGTGVSGLPVFLPAGGLSGSPLATILGKPAIPTEFNATLGTVGDIILTDLGTYLTASRGGIESAVSMHLYFLTHEQAFRFSMRIDGKSWWTSALTPKSGGSTQSNIVTLATRA